MSFIRDEYQDCPACRAKPGAPSLCAECLERRELHAVVAKIRVTLASNLRKRTQLKFIRKEVEICEPCRKNPVECPRHGR